MPAGSSNSTSAVVELAPRVFLTLDGRVLHDAPRHARVIRGTLDAAGGDGDGAAAFTVAPLKDKTTVWEDLADDATRVLKLSASFKQSAIHALELVGGIASIVGAVGTVKSLLEMSGIFGDKATLDQVLKAVWANYTATVAASKLDHLRSVADHVGVAEGAADAVDTFRQLPGTRPALLEWQQPLTAACMALTDRAYQRVIFNPAEYVQLAWFGEWGWLDVPDQVTAGLPADAEPVQRMIEHPGSTDRFDYRFVLGAILFAVTVRVAMMHAIEPEFRSTGRYRAELQTLCGRLRVLLNQWRQSVQWSWNPKDDVMPPVSTWPLSGPPVHADYVPVGAVDICSGFGVWTTRFQPEWNPNAPPNDPAHWAQPYVPSGMWQTGPLAGWPAEVKARYYDDADALRAAARQSVLDESGLLAFAAFVTALCSLTSDPPASETVAISVKRSVDGLILWQWRHTGNEERVAGGVFCARRSFQAEIWERPANVGLAVRTQTPESRETFIIPYRYFLVTGAGRVELTAGPRRSLTLEAPHFVAERGPGGEFRDVPTEPTEFGPVTLDYTLTVQSGQTQVTLSLLPAEGNVSLEFLVEETIQSGQVFQTTRDLSIVTREHRLPSAYFTHVADCEKKANQMLKELNHRFAISAEPAARFDPRRHTHARYLEVVQREQPDVFYDVLARVVGPQ